MEQDNQFSYPLELVNNYPWLLDNYKFLIDSYKQGISHHAYLLIHQGEIGQEVLARNYANFLLCQNNNDPQALAACGHCTSCEARKLQSNKNFIVLDQPDSNILSVNSVREMIDSVAFPPISSPLNVVLIPNASKFNTSSGNAILKTLEEPPEKTKFVLLLPAGFEVLPTIKSRCLNVKLNRPSRQDIKDFLVKHELISAEGKCLTILANNQPDLILAMHEQGFYEVFDNFCYCLGRTLQTGEISYFVESFLTGDYQKFKWQVKSLIDILDLVFNIGLRTLDAQFTDEELASGKYYDFIHHLVADDVNRYNKIRFYPDSTKIVVQHLLLFRYLNLDHLENLYNSFMLTLYQLNVFPNQISSKPSLTGIAYKLASELVLFEFDYIYEEAQAQFKKDKDTYKFASHHQFIPRD